MKCKPACGQKACEKNAIKSAFTCYNWPAFLRTPGFLPAWGPSPVGPANENNFKSQAGSPAGGLPFRYNGESELNSGGTRMTDWQTTELQAALVNSLVDQSQGQASVNFGPRLLDNQGTPTWLTLRHHLLNCRRFCFSVAFISDAMVSNLKPLLRQLAARGGKGQL